MCTQILDYHMLGPVLTPTLPSTSPAPITNDSEMLIYQRKWSVSSKSDLALKAKIVINLSRTISNFWLKKNESKDVTFYFWSAAENQ